MYQVGTVGPTGTGAVSSAHSKSPAPGGVSEHGSVRGLCNTLARFLGREKGTTLGEMNSSSKRGCAQFRQCPWLLLCGSLPADAARQRAHGDQPKLGLLPGTSTLAGTFWARDCLGWEG